MFETGPKLLCEAFSFLGVYEWLLVFPCSFAVHETDKSGEGDANGISNLKKSIKQL